METSEVMDMEDMVMDMVTDIEDGKHYSFKDLFLFCLIIMMNKFLFK
jgi:hypothetical protein